MAVHRGGTSFTCDNQNGCAVTGADGATFAFTPKPGTGGGGTVVRAGAGDSSPRIQFAVYSSQGDDESGSGTVLQADSGTYTNVQFNNIDRQTTNPLLTAANAGRRFYAGNSDGSSIRFFGFLRSDNAVGDNGATDRVRFDIVLGENPTTASTAQANAAASAGDNLWLASADDDGTSTSFASAPAATTATSFSLHGANTGYIANGDTITTALPYSTSSITL